MNENFLTLYNDPGEDFGWAVGRGLDLLAAGTHKMWPFIDLVWEKLGHPDQLELAGGEEPNPLASATHIRDGVDPENMRLPIGRIVCEDFRLYPWEADNLAYDPMRTPRAIGALTAFARIYRIPFHLQGANIKKAAVAAGAEELYYRPLRENRHQNDAIQHYVFFTNVELMGVKLPVPSSVTKEDTQS